MYVCMYVCIYIYTYIYIYIYIYAGQAAAGGAARSPRLKGDILGYFKDTVHPFFESDTFVPRMPFVLLLVV